MTDTWNGWHYWQRILPVLVAGGIRRGHRVATIFKSEGRRGKDKVSGKCGANLGSMG